MITAHATGANGEHVIVLGVTAANVRKLQNGEPIHVNAATHPGLPPGIIITIFYGATERDCTTILKPLMDDATKIIAVPRDEGTPS
jgi:hypothetical protein